MRRITVLLVQMTAVFAAGGAAYAGSPADLQAAEAAVLTQADVPSGFSGGPVSTADDELESRPECGGKIAKADEAYLTAPHARSGFRLAGPRSSVIVQSDVGVLASVKKAKKAFKAYKNKSAFTTCAEAVFEDALATPNVRTKAELAAFSPERDDKGKKKVIKGGDEYVGAKGSVEGTQGTGTQVIEVEMAIVRDDRSLARLILVNAGLVSPDDTRAMLQTLVDNLGEI